jgi:hypothetical protein
VPTGITHPQDGSSALFTLPEDLMCLWLAVVLCLLARGTGVSPAWEDGTQKSRCSTMGWERGTIITRKLLQTRNPLEDPIGI